MYDYEDFYEPSEFEEKAEELKDFLRESVKKEVMEEIEKLKAENKKLQGIKEHFEEIKRDYEKKKSECDRIVSNAEFNAKRTRFVELMKNVEVILYGVSQEYAYIEKCDKCDSWRHVRITLPSGKKVDDECTCYKHKWFYLPRIDILYEFKHRDGEMIAFYKKRGEEKSEYFALDTVSKIPKLIVDHDMSFEDIPSEKDVYFKTIEECQEYCDYLNKKQHSEGYKYKVDGSVITPKRG